jgi:hypothetical protein
MSINIIFVYMMGFDKKNTELFYTFAFSARVQVYKNASSK